MAAVDCGEIERLDQESEKVEDGCGVSGVSGG